MPLLKTACHAQTVSITIIYSMFLELIITDLANLKYLPVLPTEEMVKLRKICYKFYKVLLVLLKRSIGHDE